MYLSRGQSVILSLFSAIYKIFKGCATAYTCAVFFNFINYEYIALAFLFASAGVNKGKRAKRAQWAIKRKRFSVKRGEFELWRKGD